MPNLPNSTASILAGQGQPADVMAVSQLIFAILAVFVGVPGAIVACLAFHSRSTMGT